MNPLGVGRPRHSNESLRSTLLSRFSVRDASRCGPPAPLFPDHPQFEWAWPRTALRLVGFLLLLTLSSSAAQSISRISTLRFESFLADVISLRNHAWAEGPGSCFSSAATSAFISLSFFSPIIGVA